MQLNMQVKSMVNYIKEKITQKYKFCNECTHVLTLLSPKKCGKKLSCVGVVSLLLSHKASLIQIW